MQPWRRKAIRRPEGPWGVPEGQQPLAAPPPASGGWLAGPTWLYAAAAALVFAVAIVVAVLQATGGDDAEASQQQPAQVGQTEQPTQPAQSQAAQTTSEPSAQQPAVQQESVPPASEQQSAAAPQESPQQVAEQQEPSDPLLGFTMPIAGACVSEYDGHWPAALRAYRNNGIHEGLDFYNAAACVTIDSGTPVLAAKAGAIIRADRAYVDVTPDDWARFEAASFEGEAILDELRGRQVWIDHGQGIVTRYAHLSAIAAQIFEGVRVEAGAVIGFVGESGQRESYAAPGSDLHLHFEIRVGDGWLGQGLEPSSARALYLAAFGVGG